MNLIVLKQEPSTLELLQAGSIYVNLFNKGKKVAIYAANAKVSEKMNLLLSTDKVEYLESLPPQKYLLSIPKQESDVESVQWQQEESKLNIYINLQSGVISNRDLKLQALPREYSEIILINSEPTDLDKNAEKSADSYSNSEWLKFSATNSSETAKSSLKVTQKLDSSFDTISESIQAYLGANLSKAAAHLLYVALMLETKNLSLPIKNSQLFLHLKELVDNGAEPAKVSATLEKIA